MRASILNRIRCLAALTLCSTAAAVPIEPIYQAASQQLHGGFAGINAGTFSLDPLTATEGAFSVDFKFKDSAGFTIPVGYEYGSLVSVFATFGHYTSGFDAVIGNLNGSTQSVASAGDLTFMPLMLNAAVRVPIAARVHIYLGAGAGVVYEKVEFNAFDYPDTKSILFGALKAGTHTFGGMSDAVWEIGFQAFGGLDFDIVPNITASLGYRYLHLGGMLSVDGNNTSHFTGHSFEGGLRVKF